MDEKVKLYMKRSTINEGQFYASNRDENDALTPGLMFYNNGRLIQSPAQFYKSLKSLAVAIRKAGFIGVDKTK